MNNQILSKIGLYIMVEGRTKAEKKIYGRWFTTLMYIGSIHFSLKSNNIM